MKAKFLFSLSGCIVVVALIFFALRLSTEKQKIAPASSVAPVTSEAKSANAVTTTIPREQQLLPPSNLANVPRVRIFDMAGSATSKYLLEGIDPHAANAASLMLARLHAAWNFLVPRANFATLSQSSASLVSDFNFRREFEKNSLTIFQSPDQAFIAAELYSLSVWMGAMIGREIPQPLLERANALPITELDVLSVSGIRDGLAELSPVPSTIFPKLSSIEPYSAAQNPVYRYLSLELVNVALPNDVNQPPASEGGERDEITKARVKALTAYARESDPTIVAQLIGTLEPTSAIESANLLTEIQKQQMQLGARPLADRAGMIHDAIVSRIEGNSQK